MNSFENIKKEEIDAKEFLEKQDVDNDKIKKIEEILNWSYDYELSTTIPTKTSVTKIKQMQNEENIETTLDNYLIDVEKDEKNKEKVQENSLPKPKFLRKEDDDKITSAQKGTLVHLCLQKLNEKQEYTLQEIKDLINELELKQIITNKESRSISTYKILAFTKSTIWKELRKAKVVEKEKPFYINIPAKEIYNQEIEEDILVQGIIDLYYINENDELVLVDYKTDYVEKGKEEELLNKYRKQLDLYKRALESALNRKVDKVYIYSVYLEKEIEYI